MTMDMGLEFDPTGESRRRLERVPWRRFVALGDSVVEGVLGDPYPPYPEVGWTQMIAEALQAVEPELQFFNLGKRYLTAKQVRNAQLEEALALEPDLALIWAGGNDLLLEDFDAKVTEEEFDTMVGELSGAGATVVIGTMYNMPAAGILAPEVIEFFGPRFVALNESVRRVGDRYGTVFIDFAEMDWTADADLYSEDLQHVNRRGYAASAQTTIRYLADHLESELSEQHSPA